jgi:hypothetical protein
VNVEDGWIGAEGEEEGRPVLVRVRDISLEAIPEDEFPHLLSSTWRFGEDRDGSGLPSAKQYAELERFELVFDKMEEDGSGVLAIVRTHAGSVEHVAFVRDVEEGIAAIRAARPKRGDFELAASPDNRWDEYRAARDALVE